MAEPPTATTPTPAPAAAPPLKKGSLVRVNPSAYAASPVAAASDPLLPGYLIEGPGEVLLVRGAYAQLRWRRPVPDVWLPLDVLEAYPG